jgi:hypothetical protein
VFVPLRILSDAVAWPHLTCSVAAVAAVGAFVVADAAVAGAAGAAAFVVADAAVAGAVGCLILLTRTTPRTLLLEVAEGSFQGNQQSIPQGSQQYNQQGCQKSS